MEDSRMAGTPVEEPGHVGPPLAAQAEQSSADTALARKESPAKAKLTVRVELSLGDLESNMAETQMSFNLQYLMLQEQMQDENRQYVAVSNIMKTLADIQKSLIENVR